MYQSYTTWTALNAAPGTTANEIAYVYGPDTGTHTDPVVGGTVDNAGVYGWSVSPAGWQWLVDLTVTAQEFNVVDNDTTAQTQLIWSPEQSAINSEGGYDNVDLSIRTSKNYIANFGDGTFGTDYVFGLGWNQNAAFTNETAGLPACGYRIESKYRYNRLGNYVTQCEVHVGATWTADATGAAEFRPITIGAPHFKADWAESSSMTFTNAYISFLDGTSPGTQFMTIDARASHGGARFVTTIGVVHREETNALAWYRQKNAAGTSFINLPYVDGTNAYHFDRDVFAQIDTPLTNGLGAKSYYCVQGVGSLSSGAYLIYMSTPAVTGNTWAFLFDGNASTFINGEVKNNHASGAARLDLTANGDTTILFAHTASGRKANFKFGNAGRRLESDVPVKLPIYTVAALPTVADAGAGARAFVNNANATTFASVVAGGGSNVVPVYSDGSNWRIG